MLPELGNLALMIALSLALVQSVLPLYGAWKNKINLMRLARPLDGKVWQQS